MIWLKRGICVAIALFLMYLGTKFIFLAIPSWFFFGLLLLAGGIILAHIAVLQRLPNYSFWITLTAIGLAITLYETQTNKISSDSSVSKEQTSDVVKKKEDVVSAQKRKPLFDVSAYPRINGSISIVSANVLYIGGRRVRLYGIDAPDMDQICSDSLGGSYNCGEEAALWLSSWIDKNPIDCYLIQVNPNGVDVGVCMWGEQDVGSAIVGAGWAIANKKETDKYLPFQAKAKSLELGLWQGTFWLPSDWREIKRHKNDFTIVQKNNKSLFSGSFFNFKSWFK